MAGTWELLGSASGGSGTMSVSFTTGQENLFVQFQQGTNVQAKIQYNDDDGSNQYSFRRDEDGTEQSVETTTYIRNWNSGSATQRMTVMQITNQQTKKKEAIHRVFETTSGADEVGNRMSGVSEWNNTSAKINKISFTALSGSFDSSDSMTVWGATGDVNEMDNLTNVPANTRYEETDTRKIYRRILTTDVTIGGSGTTAGGLGGASGTISKVGAKLDNSSYSYIGKTITQVKFRVKKNNSPTGNGSCHVYASSDANMTGTPKATSSSTVDWATLPSSNPSAGTFSATFDFSGFTLADGDRIVITGGSYNNSNEVQALRDSSATNSSWKTAFGYNNGNSTYVSTDTMNLEFTTNEGSWKERGVA